MVDTSLLQYGAVGTIAVLGIAVARALFAKIEAAHKRDSERADRLEAELRNLNNLIQNRYAATLSDATKAIADALAMVRRKG